MSAIVDSGSRDSIDAGSFESVGSRDTAVSRTRLDGQFMRRRVRRFTWRSKCWRISLAPGALRHANPDALAARLRSGTLDMSAWWSL